ncbi:hypothetical protein EOM39_00430 [Candidatus Gracilibacteria bacterium]|nr:hypothetical protein [Candidatus Gracilibacteria bacterium]
MKKLALFILLITIVVNPISLIYAKTKITYQKAEGLALQYIKNSIDDENWKNNNPKIEGEGKYFYNDNENNPGYIEFKVSCDNNTDCGFVLVNIDGDDVAVPISSTVGNTPSEVVYQEGDKKLYYFDIMIDNELLQI